MDEIQKIKLEKRAHAVVSLNHLLGIARVASIIGIIVSPPTIDEVVARHFTVSLDLDSGDTIIFIIPNIFKLIRAVILQRALTYLQEGVTNRDYESCLRWMRVTIALYCVTAAVTFTYCAFAGVPFLQLLLDQFAPGWLPSVVQVTGDGIMLYVVTAYMNGVLDRGHDL